MKLRSNSRRILFNELEGDSYLLKTIEQNSVKYFIDIGANVGFISIMARMLHPKMKIFSFEPHPEVYENLNENVNHLKINTYNLALGTGEPFYLLKSRKTDLCNSFTNEKTDNYNVSSYRLSDIVSVCKVDVLDTWFKIDCEGAEKYLIGDNKSEEILKKCKAIAIEVHKKIGNDLDVFVEWFVKTMINTHVINICKNSESLIMISAIRRN